MSPHAVYVLALTVVALVLFSTEKLRVDVVALLLLLALTIPGVLTPDEAIAGFGSDTIVILISLFVMTEGVIRTGVVERIGLRLAALGSVRPLAFTRFLIVACTVVSAFISNTVTAAVFLPIVVGASRRAKVPATKLLMPMAFASILSSGVTVISTSTNLVMSGQMPRYGLESLGFFELAPLGLVVTVVGLVYLLFVAPRLIPDRGIEETADSERRYVSEVVVPEASTLVGKTLAQLHLDEVMDLLVVGIRRGTRRILRPWPGAKLRPGDELVVEGKAGDILGVKDLAGLEIKTEANPSETQAAPPERRMIEGMVLPRSPLVGRTLRETRFRQETGLDVLAIHSAGTPGSVDNLSRWRLRPSDVLLLQGNPEDLARIPDREVLLLDDVSSHHPRSAKGRWATTIFVAALALGATRVLPLPIAFLAGAVGMVLSRCLEEDEAYSAIDWRLMVLIGSMMAFGTAMSKSGAAEWLAGGVVGLIGPFGGWAVMCAFCVLTVALTQPMSNQAAALVVLPVAIAAAKGLGLEPRTLAIAITLAASLSFLTPLEPACLLVYGPGRYRFFDFVRAGAPLTLVALAITVAMVPLFWPLYASG
jgi:di/tricarboxylate transporter